MTPVATPPSPSTTTPPSMAQVRVWPWNSINGLLHRAGEVFDAGADVIELKGLPFRIYCFRNPDHIEQIFKDPQVGGTKNPKLLDRLKWAMPRSGVVLKGGQEWRERRRQVQAAFKSQKLAKFAGHVAPLVQEMLAHWKSVEGRTEGFDLSHEMHNLVTRLAFKMYFSKELTGSELERIAYESHFIEFNFVRRTPLFIPTPGNLKFKKYVHNLQGTLQSLLNERRASKAEHDDLLATMVNLFDINTNQPWPDREIVAETFNVYIATCLLGTSLCWSLYLLSQNQDAQDRLRAEARTVLGDRLPTVDDLANMPYSEMVMDEVLRRFPSSWGLPRLCEQGMNVGGLQVPSGSMVIPMVYFVHHHRGLWDDPLRFDPERFSPENRKKIGTFSYFPYGRGERTCLGVNLAPLIVRQILAMICRDYRVTFKPQSPHDPVIDIAFEIHPRDKMVMAIERVPAG